MRSRLVIVRHSQHTNHCGLQSRASTTTCPLRTQASGICSNLCRCPAVTTSNFCLPEERQQRLRASRTPAYARLPKSRLRERWLPDSAASFQLVPDPFD
jgi:hypothetical protein